MAMLAALSYLLTAVIHIPLFPAAPFLTYDPKDIAIIIGGFLFGPFPAFLMSLIVSLVEMVTIGDTGPIGALMNVLSTCSFACTAAFIYKKRHTLKGAITGLAVGVLLMTAAMLLWNYLITPLYMGMPRAAVAAMLPTVFLPFNFVKGSLNAALTLLIYKPVAGALRSTHLAPQSADPAPYSGKISRGVMAGAAVVLIAIIAVLLALRI